MKKIKFIKNPSASAFMIGGHFEGDIAELPTELANELIQAGYALPYEEGEESKPKKGK